MVDMKGSYGQKFKDDFCGKCMHYYYATGKKIYSEQSKCCFNPKGECQRLLRAVIVEALK